MRVGSSRNGTKRLAVAFAGAALGLLVGSLPTAAGEPGPGVWQRLEPGLEYASFRSPVPAEGGDSRIRVLRIDPRRFELQLLNVSAFPDGAPMTAKEWARRHDLVAATNASLYQADYRTSVSLMKTRDHTNNPRLSKDNAILAFDRLDDAVPPVQIIDRTCDDLPGLQEHYGALVQSIRMISCQGKNVWRPQDKAWSTAAIGIDRAGRVLFIHVRSPFSTHDLIEGLLALPLEHLPGDVRRGRPAGPALRPGGRSRAGVRRHVRKPPRRRRGSLRCADPERHRRAPHRRGLARWRGPRSPVTGSLRCRHAPLRKVGTGCWLLGCRATTNNPTISQPDNLR